MSAGQVPSARTFALGGIALMMSGLFIGANLDGLGWFGFLVALGGSLALLYGVLAIIYRQRPR